MRAAGVVTPRSLTSRVHTVVHLYGCGRGWQLEREEAAMAATKSGLRGPEKRAIARALAVEAHGRELDLMMDSGLEGA